MSEIRKATKGLNRLVVWPQTADTVETLTYGTAVSLDKVIMTATDTPTIAEGSLSAGDQVVEQDFENTDGTLAIGLTGINGADRELFYGNKLAQGTNIINKNDMGSYVAVAYMTLRPDGLYNLFKKFKVKFAPGAETFNTKQKGQITYATTNLNGTYIPTIHDGNSGAVRYGVDPVEDAAIITSWFTTADYIAPTGE